MEPEFTLTNEGRYEVNENIKASAYLSPDEKYKILEFDFKQQAKHFNVPIMIRGKAKAGKSLICNELLGFRIEK